MGLSNNHDSRWCKQVLQEAIDQYGKPEIVNSDRGSQYTSALWVEFLEDLQPSVAPNTVYIDVADIPGMEEVTRETSNLAVSKGKYIELEGISKEPVIATEFNINKSGKYSLLLRVAIKDNLSSRKFQLILDNHEEVVSFETAFRWNVIDENNFKVVYLQELEDTSVGKHQISLKAIGGKINLNQLIITDNPGVFFEQYWHREQK